MTVSLRVQATGPLLLVQDQGRPGAAHLGVPPSGALDLRALALANRLVGNVDGAAGLEVLLGGLRLTTSQATRIAVTGAQMPLVVGGRAMPWGEPVSVRAGDVVELGQATGGLRSWLAVAGGIDCPEVLGSRSTDTLTGIGPAPVGVGDELAVGRSLSASLGQAAAIPPLRTSGVIELVMSLGPRDDWLTSASRRALVDTTYEVSPDSDRTGVRLCGTLLRHGRDDELASEGIVGGSVQVPPSGQPLVFLADHPVTGGYPVVGVVDAAGVARCAQLRPGDRVRFTTKG